MYTPRANECGSQVMKGLKMCFGFLVTQPESAVETKPGVGSFYDITQTAQATPVFATWRGKQRNDSALFDTINIFRSTVCRVAHIAVGAIAGPASRSLKGWNLVKQVKRRLGIVNVGRANCDRQWDAGGVCDDMALAAIFRSVCRVRTGVIPPKTARTDWLSTTARDRSICPSLLSVLSKRLWTSGQTPKRVQSRKRRQQLTPLPQPSSLGSMRQAAPVRSTKTMPSNAARFEIGGRPPFGLGFCTGSNGSIACHNSSGTRAKAMHISLKRVRMTFIVNSIN
jgi:hypothetical protein